ncbi:MAG: hypothetical protein U1E05_05975 [Patescibacteria group bacterium]|nr:hypothetical protein [Patescibacteria group bacterium]
MSRYVPTWLAFMLCLAVVLGAMGWVSRAVLQLEHERLLARRNAAFEDNVRLALWRMDTAVAPLLATENARPHFAYGAFFESHDAPAGGAMPGRLLAPSPLLREPPDHVLVYFQFDEQGRLTSPQVPDSRWRELAIPVFTSPGAVAAAEQRLVELGRKTDRVHLLTLLPEQVTSPAEWVLAPLVAPSEQQSTLPDRRGNLKQQGRAAVEFEQRAQAV